ncbi:hypothetical protein FNJ59_10860 [Bacteroides pyogenes]|nr:hypothetical protein FNJ59_10860 [Bacteroides pyogenes]
MKNMKKLIYILFIAVFLLPSCQDDENKAYVPEKAAPSADEIDKYFQENFQDKYRCAIRWKWVDRYVDISYIVAPAMRKVVVPTGEMLRRFWIEPFILESKASADFIRDHFPPEIVLVGSELRNADGTRTLGYADAGVRITLTELNYFDLSRKDWVIQQLHTIHHEFSHIIHQKYNLPVGFNKVTENNYTGRAWQDMYVHAQQELGAAGVQSPTQHQVDSVARNRAIMKGMLTPYGTSTEFEDFAELVSIYLLTDPVDFETTYLQNDLSRPFLNEGKTWIDKKLTLVKEYYQSNFSIDLEHLREIILQRLNQSNMK